MLVRELPEQENQSKSWICGSCHNVWYDPEMAENCCSPVKCQQCSGSARPGRTLCDKCLAQMRVVHDEEMFRTAQKVFYTEYEGRLFWTPPGARDGELFGCRTDIEKRCVELGVPPPKWVWATEKIGFLLDAEHVLSGAMTRTNEDVRSLLTDEQVESLQQILDDWSMNQDLKCWDLDDTTAVVLDRALFENVRKKDSSH